jgi:hypothetical protein
LVEDNPFCPNTGNEITPTTAIIIPLKILFKNFIYAIYEINNQHIIRYSPINSIKKASKKRLF